MEVASLETLPDDLILDITQQLGTAGDIAHLSTTSKRLYSVTKQDGWKTFVRSRFPAVNVPQDALGGWGAVADRLTYLDRCWDKRGLFINIFSERQPDRSHRRGRPKGQSVPFHPVLGAHFCAAKQTEIVAWGVGEDLLIRQRLEPGTEPDAWDRISGHSFGYAAGIGDVTAVAVIERGGTAEVSVGRANGDIQLLSAAGDDCGQVTTALIAPDEAVGEAGAAVKKSPGQLAVTWTEWQPQTNMLACCKSSQLTLYNLGEADGSEIPPSTHVDVSELRNPAETPLLRNAKFIGHDAIACALGGSREPLRFYKIMPTGLEPLNGSRDLAVPAAAAAAAAGSGLAEKTTVRAIESVGQRLSQNLLLSAWDDGSYRLNDLRTPSAYNAIYRDRFQPFQGGSSLLVYGTERFVSGSNFGPDLRFFDFRFPKSYHHTDGLPCSSELPSPDVVRQYYSRSKEASEAPAERCNHLLGTSCAWHAQSRRDEWRPDAVLHVGNSYLYDRVYSLAKASDLSPAFYCGLRGAVLEMNLTLAEHVSATTVSRTAPPGWQVDHSRVKVAFQEPGIGLEKNKLDEMDESGVPRMWYHRQELRADTTPSARTSRRRLDSAYKEVVSELPYV